MAERKIFGATGVVIDPLLTFGTQWVSDRDAAITDVLNRNMKGQALPALQSKGQRFGGLYQIGEV